MLKVEVSFTDVVSGRDVFRLIDYKGRLWLANNRWAFLNRIRIGHEVSIEHEVRQRSFYGSQS